MNKKRDEDYLDILKFIFKTKNANIDILHREDFVHYFEQYKLYITSAYSEISRYDSLNNYMLSLTTIIATALGYCLINYSKYLYFALVLSFVGLLISALWQDIIAKIKDRIVIKFRNIFIMEIKMPMLCILSEMKELRKDPEEYLVNDDILFTFAPMAGSEAYIRAIFFVFFWIILLISLIMSIIRIYPRLKITIIYIYEIFNSF
ncbi:MAG: hypothetical protein V1794_00190 [Candidatus Glassbacteria bacterium]